MRAKILFSKCVDILLDPASLMQPAQPCDRVGNAQSDQSSNGCTDVCALDATDDASNGDRADCIPDATVNATAKALTENDKTLPIAGLQRLQGVDEDSDFEERAAILEYDAGLSRAEAEAQANLDRRGGTS